MNLFTQDTTPPSPFLFGEMTTSIVSTEIMELDPLFSRMAGFVLPNAHFLNSNHPTPPPPAGCGEVVVHGGITGLISCFGFQFLLAAGLEQGLGKLQVV